MNLKADQHIEATPEAVWARLMVPDTWLQILPFAKRVELLTPPPLAVGSRARFTMEQGGRTVYTEARVTTLEPPRRLALHNQVPDVGVQVDAMVDLVPDGTGTRVTQSVTFHFDSFMAKTVGAGMIRAQKPEARLLEGLTRLKQAVEGAK